MFIFKAPLSFCARHLVCEFDGVFMQIHCSSCLRNASSSRCICRESALDIVEFHLDRCLFSRHLCHFVLDILSVNLMWYSCKYTAVHAFEMHLHPGKYAGSL